MANDVPKQQLNVDHICIPAVCEVNDYVHPTSGVCATCPTNSTSGGGTPSMCTCNAGTGRINETDVTLPCLGEFHNTAHLIVVSEESQPIVYNALPSLS